MKLEDQVCRLELAMKLEKLGVKRDSLFVWRGARQRYSLQLDHNFRDSLFPAECFQNLCETAECKNTYSAYTVAELGEMLILNKEDLALPRYWNGFWEYEGAEEKFIRSSTEADARAKMLIYLIENKLINTQIL